MTKWPTGGRFFVGLAIACLADACSGRDSATSIATDTDLDMSTSAAADTGEGSDEAPEGGNEGQVDCLDSMSACDESGGSGSTPARSPCRRGEDRACA